jgi:hypothetical protein
VVYDKSAVQILVEVWDENTKPLLDKIVGTAELRSDTDRLDYDLERPPTPSSAYVSILMAILFTMISSDLNRLTEDELGRASSGGGVELTLALKEKGKIKLTLRCNVLKKGRY